MKSAVGAVVAAFAASTCCLGPVVAAAFGAGTLGAASARFEPYRPWLLGAAVILIGAAFVTTYRREPTCANEACAPAPRCKARVVFWVAAVLVGLLAAFPYDVKWLV